MRRGIAATALVAALAVSMAACSSGGSGKSDSGKSGTGKAAADPAGVSGTVTYWDTSDATKEAPAYKELIAKFEQQYPKIKVNYQNIPFADIEQKFKATAQSGKGAPDVMRADVGLIPEYASLSYLAPLDGTAALTKTEDFLPGPLHTTQYNSKSYGVPSVTDTLGLLYNKDLFKKAGIAAPPKTWDEFKQDSAQIKEKTGAYGTYMNPDAYFLLPFLFGEGADMADADAKKITINSPEAVKALATAKDVYTSSSMKIDFASAYDNMQKAFTTGKVAMLIQGPWSTADDYAGAAFKDKDNLGYAPVPAGSTGTAAAPTGGHDLVVYAGSKNLDASYLFTQFMTSTDSQAYIAVKNGTLPTRDSAYTAEVKANASIAGFQGILQTARPRVALPQVGSLFTPLQQSYVKILQGSATPQQGADEAAKEFKKLLPDFSTN
ncbi:extracellular solute-binding protein [Streptomyces sp. NPDC092296]|uniref:extracellular solute-binding protein n=1 Tax=Streptomyces sp. NPDC092296 TaxID=3366012 RepID=UPI0038068594